MHIPSPDLDEDDEQPEREKPQPVPPDMEPVVPQQDPPRPDEPGGPAPMIARQPLASVPLEVLNRAFVLLRRLACVEGTDISALPRFRVLLARVQAILA